VLLAGAAGTRFVAHDLEFAIRVTGVFAELPKECVNWTTRFKIFTFPSSGAQNFWFTSCAMPMQITELTRTDIVDALLLDKEQPFHGNLDMISFLKRVWPLETMPSEDSRFENAECDIWQHTVNNYDYNESELLYKRLRITGVPDKQFVRFLETCLNPIVARDPKRIEALAAMFNSYLKNDGFVAQPFRAGVRPHHLQNREPDWGRNRRSLRSSVVVRR
jgi:hypothetical protein